MKSKNKSIINQSIPDEFSSTYINYKVEHNPNIHYNYNPAEITAMREEKIREAQENKKRQQISECMTKCKQNIIKYNQEKQNETNKINESVSSVQRGKEYNENLRKQMKMKAEKKKKENMNNKGNNGNNGNNENELSIKNYDEEVIPTFSFKEQANGENVDMDGNEYNEFYNNNINIVDLYQKNMSQIQDNNGNNTPFVTRTLASNFYLANSNNKYNCNVKPTNLMDNNSYNFQPNDYHNQSQFQNKDMNIKQQINNNIQLIQKFRQTGSLANTNDISNNYYLNDEHEMPQPQPEPMLIAGKVIQKNNNNINSSQNQNRNLQFQDMNLNDISSIKSGANYSTHMHNNSNYSNNIINESSTQSKYQGNNRSKNKNNGNTYKSPYEMNELQQKRYKKALRKLVIDRLNNKKIDIPSICSCGQLQRKIDSLLNENKLITQDDLINVDCANNCIYYQKPGSYHRALTDIIQSIRTLQLENGIRK